MEGNMTFKIKSIVICFIIAGFFFTLNGQDNGISNEKPPIAYYDALKLIRYVDSIQADGRVIFKSKEADQVLKILKSYDLENFKDNPFIDLNNLETEHFLYSR